MTDPAPNFEIFYKNDTFYEITINFDNSKQYFADPERLVKSREAYKKLIKESVFPNAEGCFYFEISEPKCIQPHHDGSRIHVHGIIFITNVINWITFNLRELSRHASVQINSFRPDYWPKYIKKQQFITGEHLKPIIRFKTQTKALLSGLIDNTNHSSDNDIEVGTSTTQLS